MVNHLLSSEHVLSNPIPAPVDEYHLPKNILNLIANKNGMHRNYRETGKIRTSGTGSVWRLSSGESRYRYIQYKSYAEYISFVKCYQLI